METKLTDEQKERLKETNPELYRVAVLKGTEAPFTGGYFTPKERVILPVRYVVRRYLKMTRSLIQELDGQVLIRQFLVV